MNGSYPGGKKILEEKVVFRNNISKEEINQLNTRSFEGRIWVIENAGDAQKAVELINGHKVLGFDTETRPSFRKGKVNHLSLLQLSTPDETFLIRMQKTGFPDSLKQIFEDESVIKVGVAIRDDIKKLQKIRHFNPGGFLELQEYSNSFRIEDNSLRKLAAIVLGFKISKSQQLSNWEADSLNEAQIIYAATDSWACLEIYNKLRKSVDQYGESKDNS